MRDGYVDISTINYENKEVVLREEIAQEDVEYSFDKYETIEERKKVEEEAIEFYDIVMKRENKSYLRTIDTKLTSVTYYYEEYNTSHFEQGKMVGDSARVKKYNMTYNPYFYQLFTAKLSELGEKNNNFVDVSVKYIDELQTYFIVVRILEHEQFESLYGMSLEQYYEAINRNKYLSNMTEEDKFRSELENLKKVYISYMIEDINNGHDKGFIEIDGYQAYLMISYKYKNIKNKNEILRDIGFEVDIDNHSLILVDEELKK